MKRITKYILWISFVGFIAGTVFLLATRAPKYPPEGWVGPDVSIGTAEMDPELKDLEARILQIQVGMEAERVLKIFEGYPYSLQKDQSKPDQVTGIHEHIPKQKLPASPTRFLYFGIRFKDGKVRSKSFFPKSI